MQINAKHSSLKKIIKVYILFKFKNNFTFLKFLRILFFSSNDSLTSPGLPQNAVKLQEFYLDICE